ncbi:MAG TPA: hypothetical protein VLV78_19735 [Thermoanaerobaculia bacterium]|nr:hypothetical protein [Thermoanaerobaculia bacterium]
MKRALPFIVLGLATLAYADIPVQRVADDAKVIDRVAEAAKKDLPQNLLKRIVNEDIEALRGKRADGTYDFATFERLEASRSTESYSVQPRKNDAIERFEIKGAFVYRLLIESPTRRMLVTKNRRVNIDHVEIEYVPMNNSSPKIQNIKVEEWLEPGGVHPVDFPEVARQATVRVYAKADPAAGYGNIDMTLIKAKVVDNADSPYADAVASAKAILRAVDNADIPSIRAMAARMHDDLAPMVAPPPSVAPPTPAATVAVRPTLPLPAVTPSATPAPALQPTPNVEVYMELQSIEDLLTGTDAEKREGLDRLHQLLRRLRPH